MFCGWGRHHLTIGTMGLQEYRDKLELGKFFEGDPKYLDDIISSRKGRCGEEFKYETRDDLIKMYFKDEQPEYTFYECPATGWKYFYATLPVEYLANDKELQPRR